MSKTLIKIPRYAILGIVIFPLVFLIITACQGGLLEPPRLATATAQAILLPDPAASAIVIPAPTPTPSNDNNEGIIDESVSPNPVISVWINETSKQHEDALIQMADEFTTQYQIDVELMLVSPLLLPELVSTAVLSGTLPDIIIHPLEFSVGWAEEGVFNLDATNSAISDLGVETFNPAALNVLTTPDGTAAIPSDGYAQILLYREDWVEDSSLPAPTTFADMFAFAEATFDAETLLTAGFVIPTESNLISTHQAFEQLASANGCDLIDLSGEIQFLSQACLDSLNFYFDIVHNFSPPGIQTDASTKNAYLNGRTGMVMVSPALLPMIASLDDANLPTCDECLEAPAFLAENSQIVTAISATADSPPTSFASLTALGITVEAQPKTAVLFANYWFNEGYEKWLAVNNERKVPMRWGTAQNPTQFVDGWGTVPLGENGPSLQTLYGETAVENLKNSVLTFDRWGYAQGRGGLMTSLFEELTISIVLQEMLSGYFDPSQTSFEAYNRIVELLPNYQFPIIEPTEEPEE